MAHSARAWVVVLAVLAALTGCSSSGPPSATSSKNTTSSPPSTETTCAQANTDFDSWVTADVSGSDGDANAVQGWLKFDNSQGGNMPDPSSPELLAAISAYSAADQHAHALRGVADQDLANYQADLKNCDQASLPADCKADFGQHPVLMASAEREAQADQTLDRLIKARQAAFRADDVNAVNAQTDAFNTAVDARDAANNAWNSAVDAHSSAASQCSLATPGPAVSG